MKTLPHIRKQEILAALKEHGSIDAQALAQRFGVTYMTIHRDLRALEEQGLISRIYGGAAAVEEPSAAAPDPDPERNLAGGEESRFIARAAAAQVQDGDVIAMDGSPFALQMCPLLHRRDITVVTNSLNIALEFADSQQVQVLMTGGRLHRGSLSLMNLQNPEMLDNLNIDKYFFSAAAISPHKGVVERRVDEAEAKRQLLRRSDKAFLMLHHTRLGGTAPYVDCPCDALYAIVTDRYAGFAPEMAACLRELSRAGVRIVYGTP